MPSNIQWQTQQTKQVALTPQTHMPQQTQALPLRLQPGPPYNVNLVDQQQQTILAKEVTEQSRGYLNAPIDVMVLQQKAEVIGPQQQSLVPVALTNGSQVVSKSVSGEEKSDTRQTAGSKDKVKEQNNDYEEEEMSPYPQKNVSQQCKNSEAE